MQTVFRLPSEGLSRWILVIASIVLSSFFMWRFFVSGLTYSAASGLGFLLITPYLWMRPVNFFRKLDQEFKNTFKQTPPHILIVIANGLGLAMIVLGSVLRWFTP